MERILSHAVAECDPPLSSKEWKELVEYAQEGCLPEDIASAFSGGYVRLQLLCACHPLIGETLEREAARSILPALRTVREQAGEGNLKAAGMIIARHDAALERKQRREEKNLKRSEQSRRLMELDSRKALPSREEAEKASLLGDNPLEPGQ